MDGGTSQDSKRKRSSSGHSQTGEHRRKDKSGQRNEGNELVTHELESVGIGINQNSERKRASEEH